MGITEPDYLVGRVLIGVMYGVIHTPGCQAYIANGVLFILV